ncbi:MAG: adenylate/guanylate cyclase domain-containing protein [Vicinamibacteria bacterium]
MRDLTGALELAPPEGPPAGSMRRRPGMAHGMLNSMEQRRRKPTLRLTITAALGLVALASSALITWISYRSSREMMIESAGALMSQVSGRIGEQTRNYLGPVKNTSLIYAQLAASGQFRPGDLEGMERQFFAVLAEYHRLKMIEFGDEQGNFVSVWRTSNDALYTRTIVRRGARVVSQTKERDPSARVSMVKSVRTNEGDGYDPRERPWYRGAMPIDGVFWTDVYAQAGTDDMIVSAAVALAGPDGRRFGVVSTAMSLGEIDTFLGTIRLGEHGKVFLADRSGRLVGFPDLRGRLVGAGAQRQIPQLATSGDRDLEGLAARPEMAKALASETPTSLFRFEADGRPCYATVVPLAYRVADGWFVGAILPEDDFLGPLKRTATRTLMIAFAVSLAAAFIAILVGRRIASSLHAIAEETRRIRRLEFDDRVLPDSAFEEVSEILGAYANMKAGLRAFEKYVPIKLVRLLLASNEDPRLGGRIEDVTILFTDIRGFSTFAETAAPQEIADRLGAYLALMAETIDQRHGTVDKFIGDAVMAFWNAPRPVPDHPYEAVAAALECLAALRRSDPADLFHTRIGIHTADVMVGNYGSPERFSYTLVGDGANLASRLEGVNKQYGTQILISAATFDRVAGRVECRKLDVIAAKGRARPTAIYEVLGLTGEVDPGRLSRAREYECGLDAYLGRRFQDAVASFDKVLAGLAQAEAGTDDLAARELRGRAVAYLATPPSADWTGVYEMATK